jgi:hypothetical protein
MTDTTESRSTTGAFLRFFAVLFASSFVVGLGAYWILHSLFGQAHVFASWFRMFNYHERHPAQYLAVVAFFYALFTAVWATRWNPRGWRRHLSVLGILIGTLLLSSVASGILYAVHDMQAGYFPAWDRQVEAFKYYVGAGLALGWILVLYSFPLNLFAVPFAYVAAYYLPLRLKR